MTDVSGRRKLRLVRAICVVGALCAVLLAGCGSSSKPAAAPGTTSTTAKSVLAAQQHFAEPTFILSSQNGRIAVARLDDGKVVQVLAPASGANAHRTAMRAPNGNVLLRGCAPSCGDRAPDYVYAPYWRDATTGTTYAGDPARVSPDGTRIAAVVTDANHKQFIRQYDVATGHVLSDLVAGVEEGFGSVTGFDWTPDSRSLVVAVAPDTGNAGGLYVVDRAAQQLPSQPTVPNSAPSDPSAKPLVFASLAVLANGHVVAIEYPFPDQHTAWPAALVDVDLHTGTRRTVLGTPGFPTSAPCDAASVTAGHSCELVYDGDSVAARGSQALLTVPSESQVWLYDGHTLRLVTTAPGVTDAAW